MILAAFYSTNQPVTTTVTKAGEFKVSKVVDGDTIEVEDGNKVEKVRLLGVDTPELHDPRKPVQCFAAEASAAAHKLLDHQIVRLEADITQGERDKYDRLLRYVYLSDGRLVNNILIEEGYAHEYTYQGQPYKFQSQFKQAQADAKEAGRGFWSDSSCGGNTKQPANR